MTNSVQLSTETVLKQVNAMIDQLQQQLNQVDQGTHEEIVGLSEILDEAKERAMKQAITQHKLALSHANNQLHFTQQQIESDYQFGKDDVKEKIYGRLRAQRKEFKDQLDYYQSKGLNCNELMLKEKELKIQAKKKDKKYVAVGPSQFKMSDAEARRDIQLIKQKVEQMYQNGQLKEE